jgi:DNA-3-methyladenine glycosylase I
LKKRDAYKDAFDNFDTQKIINYSDEKITELMKNT